jgi:hypothetical protein
VRQEDREGPGSLQQVSRHAVAPRQLEETAVLLRPGRRSRLEARHSLPDCPSAIGGVSRSLRLATCPVASVGRFGARPGFLALGRGAEPKISPGPRHRGKTRRAAYPRSRHVGARWRSSRSAGYPMDGARPGSSPFGGPGTRRASGLGCRDGGPGKTDGRDPLSPPSVAFPAVVARWCGASEAFRGAAAGVFMSPSRRAEPIKSDPSRGVSHGRK